MNNVRSLNWRKVGFALTAIGVFALIYPNSSFAQGKTSVIPIADSKKLSLGTEVTVEGTVTLRSGAFRSSFSDEGFQLQDKTSGTYISIKTDLNLRVGQKVRLTGKIAKTPLGFQMIESNETSVRILAGTARTKPIAIATGKVDDAIRGRLIKITGTVTKPVDPDAPYGFRVTIDDGTGVLIAYVSTSSCVAQNSFGVGQTVRMIGIAGKFRQQPQIYPRSPGDVKLIDKR